MELPADYIPIQTITSQNLDTRFQNRDENTKYIIEHEITTYLPYLRKLREDQEEYNYRILFARDYQAIRNPFDYSYLPVYQEGYAEDPIDNGRALITWGVGPCVVIAAINPNHGIYMTHTLEYNSFSKNSKSTASDLELSERNEEVVCQGPVIKESFPEWINYENTTLYLFSYFPLSLYARIKQLRDHEYTAPIVAYLGSSWDGSHGQIIGVKKRSVDYDNLITDSRTFAHEVTVAITWDGKFGYPFRDHRPNAGQLPEYLRLYEKEFSKYIQQKEVGLRKTQQNNNERRCIYKLPEAISPNASPPNIGKYTNWSLPKSRRVSRRASRSVSPLAVPRQNRRRSSVASNPFMLLNSNNNNPSGGRRKTRKYRR